MADHTRNRLARLRWILLALVAVVAGAACWWLVGRMTAVPPRFTLRYEAGQSTGFARIHNEERALGIITWFSPDLSRTARFDLYDLQTGEKRGAVEITRDPGSVNYDGYTAAAELPPSMVELLPDVMNEHAINDRGTLEPKNANNQRVWCVANVLSGHLVTCTKGADESLTYRLYDLPLQRPLGLPVGSAVAAAGVVFLSGWFISRPKQGVARLQ